MGLLSGAGSSNKFDPFLFVANYRANWSERNSGKMFIRIKLRRVASEYNYHRQYFIRSRNAFLDRNQRTIVVFCPRTIHPFRHWPPLQHVFIGGLHERRQ
jgi:hypothetical protein